MRIAVFFGYWLGCMSCLADLVYAWLVFGLVVVRRGAVLGFWGW